MSASRTAAAALAVVLAFASASLVVDRPAAAKRAVPVTVSESIGGVRVDWSRGLLIASAGASADLRAPTANIARVKALRSATELASAALVAAVGTLRTVDAAKERSAEALEREVVQLDVVYSSDGSAVVTLGLPIEAIRRVAAGPMPVPTAKASPLVVDARKQPLKPTVGLAIEAGGERYGGPTLYFHALPRAYAKATIHSVVGASGGVLKIAETQKQIVANARLAGAVVIVLLK